LVMKPKIQQRLAGKKSGVATTDNGIS